MTIGNTRETTVMQGISAAGGGSTREIDGQRAATTVAQELLAEITQPGLSNLDVEFRGIRAAAMYPRRLPNLPAGTQQILVGRYVPDGQDQVGEVVVTGRRGAEPVRYTSKVQFPKADEGNSFIPRLWARSHLDYLLSQGDNPAIRSDIIALSQEFHIITPYTSLLVLESDADRARFGVQRRFEMRDGEEFFAAGKADSQFELSQNQLAQFGQWRLDLPRAIFRELAAHDRDARMFRPAPDPAGRASPIGTTHRFPDKKPRLVSVDFGIVNLDKSNRHEYTQASSYSVPDVHVAAVALGFLPGWWEMQGEDPPEPAIGGGVLGAGGYEIKNRRPGGGQQDDDSRSDDAAEEEQFAHDDGFDTPDDLRPDGQLNVNAAPAESPVAADGGEDGHAASTVVADEVDDDDSETGGALTADGLPQLERASGASGKPFFQALHVVAAEEHRHAAMSAMSIAVDTDLSPTRFGFPKLTSRPGEEPPAAVSAGWTPEAIALSQSLSRREALVKLVGGVELRASGQSFTPPWPQAIAPGGSLVLYSASGWLTKSIDGESDTLVHYCRGGERGVFSTSFLLGRTRPADEQDLVALPFMMSDGSLSPLHVECSESGAHVEAAGENRAKLVLTTVKVQSDQHELPFSKEVHYFIDTQRHVLLRAELFIDGCLTEVASFEDFVQVAGCWWATQQTVDDALGRRLHKATLQVTQLAQADFDRRLQAEMPAALNVLWLAEPLPTLATARERIAGGGGSFADRMVMLEHFAGLQQWDRALKQLTAAEQLAADKPGAGRLRGEFYATSRRHEEARQWRLDEARRLIANPQAGEAIRAEALVQQAQRERWNAFWGRQYAAANELLELVELLQPVADRQLPESLCRQRWLQHRAEAYENLERREDEIPLRERLAEEAPWDAAAQQAYVEALLAAGRVEAAMEWFGTRIDESVHLTGQYSQSLGQDFVKLMIEQGRLPELLEHTTAWIQRRPTDAIVYELHLEALTFNDQLDRAIELAKTWLKHAQVEGRVESDQRARLEAAIRFGHGTLGPGYSHQVPHFLDEQLSEAILFFVRSRSHVEWGQDMLYWPMDETPAGPRRNGMLLSMLQTELNELTPKQVQVLVQNCLWGRLELAILPRRARQMDATDVPAEIWQTIAGQIRTRWQQAANPADKHVLAEVLENIYARRFQNTEWLPFLRQQVELARPEIKGRHVQALFEALLQGPWTEANEIEAFAILREGARAGDPATQLTLRVANLYRLVDAMVARRKSQAADAHRDLGQPDLVTRAQLNQRQAQWGRAALKGLADRLATEAQVAADQNDAIADWLAIEHARIDVRLGQRSDQIFALCFRILGVAPPITSHRQT